MRSRFPPTNSRYARKEERAQAQHEAKTCRDEAVFDPLTNLYNRRFFLEHLRESFARARRTRLGLGQHCIDLDGFKILNDRYGYPFGDRVLQEVAEQLYQRTCLEKYRRTIRQRRILNPGAGDRRRQRRRLREPDFELLFPHVTCHAGSKGQVSASIGAVVVIPRETKLTEVEALKCADEATYQTKRSCKNRIHIVAIADVVPRVEFFAI